MFLVFAWQSAYPGGGGSDFVGAYESFIEALQAAREILRGSRDVAEIYDVAARKWHGAAVH